MKITSILFALAALVISQGAFAQSKGKLGPAGCGLGYMIFGGKEMQILAATTNGTSGNQTFGITTGTLDCATGSDMAMLNYIQNNKVALEKDIARGNGDTVGALAQMTGCADAAQFGSALKGHYQDIFPAADRSAADITMSIKKVIGTNPDLKTTCAPLS